MRTIPWQTALALSLALVCGCGRTDRDAVQPVDQASTNTHSSKGVVYTEENLRKLIQVGMSKEAVTDILGQPRRVTTIEPGYVCFDYSFFPEDARGPRKFVVTGTTVHLRDDKVVRQQLMYGTVGGYRESDTHLAVEPQGAAAGSTNAPPQLTFWAVSGSRIEGGRYIDTDHFPKLGFIPKDPALKVSHLKAVYQGREVWANEQNQAVTNPVLNLEFAAEDVEAFSRLTTQDVGKQMLFMVDDVPVYNSRIFMPITMGRIQITCRDQREFQLVRDSLAKLLPPK